MSIDVDDAETIAMIRESAEGVADRQDLGRVRKLRFTSPGIDREVWSSMCGLGWTGLRTPEHRGGVGLGLIAYCALAEELGAALTPEPLVAAALAAAFLDGDALAAQLSGTSLTLPVWQQERDEHLPKHDLAFVGGRIHGAFSYVPMAKAADAFVVIGATGAYRVDAKGEGVAITGLETQDGGHFGLITLDGAAATPLKGDIVCAFAEATLATSAYLLGLMDATVDRSLDYLKTRVQFGKLIGNFQALQHRAVDLRLQVELTRASVEEAARRWDRAPGAPASLAAISRAKARAASAAMLTTRQAIQLHGGIGYSDEHDIGLFLRKAMVVAPQFGTADLHRANFRDLTAGEQLT